MSFPHAIISAVVGLVVAAHVYFWAGPVFRDTTTYTASFTVDGEEVVVTGTGQQMAELVAKLAGDDEESDEAEPVDDPEAVEGEPKAP